MTGLPDGYKVNTLQATLIASTRYFYSADFGNPSSADAAVNALASAEADSVNADITIRAYDDTAEEGVYIDLDVPLGATNIVLGIRSRANAAPAGISVVPINWYSRIIADGAAVGAWSAAVQLTDIAIAAGDADFDVQTQTHLIGTLGLVAGDAYQIEFTRDATDPTSDLIGDWCQHWLSVGFT
tara:strand:- start:390 stop:941 length:552 start_codon:yes stop_codon:yes gene_type:complete